MKIKIGKIEIKNQIVLAPMASVSTPSFIKIAEEFGVALAYTELISAEAIVRGNKKTFEMLKGIEKIKIPVGIQIFGANPETIAKAAKILTEKYKIKLIDINMGCPVPKVTLRSKAGSALLKDPEKIGKIVEATVKAVDVPVTVKIRSGWDLEHINAVEIAKIIQDKKASAITIHARTRSQGYSGKADLDIIKKVKENVSIPVIGNGDIKTCYDAKNMLDYTKCDAVMIGRGIIGNPWLIKECIDYIEKKQEPKKITPEEKIQMIKKHLKYLKKITEEKLAVLQMRGLIPHYLKGLPNTNKLKQEINKTTKIDEINKLLDKYLKEENYES